MSVVLIEFWHIGLVMMAACRNVETYAAAQVSIATRFDMSLICP